MKPFVIAFGAACMCAASSCSSVKNTPPQTPDLTTLHFKAAAAPEWSNLFERTSGWFGADGIFAVPRNGLDTYNSNDTAETTLFFSDTMVGEIGADGRPKPGYVMVHNSIAVLKGSEPRKDRIQFQYKTDADGKPATYFVPQTPAAQKGDYYWLGDAFLNHEKDDNTYIFCYRIRDTADNLFLFQQVGNAMIILPKGSKAPFTDQRQVDAPIYLVDSTSKYPNNYVSYGSGVFANIKSAGAPTPDGYVYVYAVSGDNKNVTVARVKPKQFEDFTAWRYWTGSEWNADIHAAVKIADRASNELSVTPLPDGRYAMVFQMDGIGNAVGLRLGATPYGPFGPIIKVWDCTEQQLGKNTIVYNAKVHSNLSKPGEMLITYNVGSFDFWNDIKVYGNFYRPRFVRVTLE